VCRFGVPRNAPPRPNRCLTGRGPAGEHRLERRIERTSPGNSVYRTVSAPCAPEAPGLSQPRRSWRDHERNQPHNRPKLPCYERSGAGGCVRNHPFAQRLWTTCWCRPHRLIVYHHRRGWGDPRRPAVTSSSRNAGRARRGTSPDVAHDHNTSRREAHPGRAGLTDPSRLPISSQCSHTTRFHGSAGFAGHGISSQGAGGARRAIFHTNVVQRALLCSNAADHLISYLYSRTRTPNE
jgi:hypothetical protein